MQDIIVSRYENPKELGWLGNIEPRDRSWIAFINLDGIPIFFLDRDPGTGACLSSSVAPLPTRGPSTMPTVTVVELKK